MNCVDLRRSLAGVEDVSTAEQQAHLKTCPACSALVAELKLIASSASELRANEEPSPRVWNSLEIALRQEGLIRPQTNQPFLVPQLAASASTRSLSSFAAGWGWRGWLVPAAAALLIAVGIFLNQTSLVHRLSRNLTPVAATPAAETVADLNLSNPNLPNSNLINPNLINPGLTGLNDDDLLQEIQNQTPAMRAQYVDNLRLANDYIRDAQNLVATNPNDEESRRSLLEAYQQKSMLFEMAMDRSLP
jgi:hypothetical protein